MQAAPTGTRATAGLVPVAALRAGRLPPILNNTLIAGFRGLVLEAGHGLKKSLPRHAASVAAYAVLNAFFAISANSPLVSMVNFSCCVRSAPTSCAPGVTRGMTAQPMGMAVRTEAGAHA